MKTDPTPEPRRSLPWKRRAVVSVLAALALLAEAACARSVKDDLEPDQSFSPTIGGTAQACVETQCPAPFATCPGAGGPCTIDLRRDVDHCGACDTPCPDTKRSSNGTYLCSDSQCKIACNGLFGDCNQNIQDGCETSLYADPLNCGGCGVACKEGELCWKGACGCPNGFTQCGGDCVKLDSDDLNCSACGVECKAPTEDLDPRWTCGPKVTPDNTKWTCGNAECTLQCKPGFGDCNTNFCGDGCEIDLLKDAANCGACGNKCGEGQWCNQGTCSCPSGTVRCQDACVDIQNDAANCGACGDRCPGPASTRPGRPVSGGPLCVAGKCSYVCKPGYADCDGRVSNGCEAELASDQKNCGACGNACNAGAGQPCVQGKCLTKACEAGPGPQ